MHTLSHLSYSRQTLTMGCICAKKAVQERLPTLYLVQGEIPDRKEIPIQGYPVQGKDPFPEQFSNKRRRWVDRCIGDF